jgi:hypothetical protein
MTGLVDCLRVSGVEFFIRPKCRCLIREFKLPSHFRDLDLRSVDAQYGILSCVGSEIDGGQ